MEHVHIYVNYIGNGAACRARALEICYYVIPAYTRGDSGTRTLIELAWDEGAFCMGRSVEEKDSTSDERENTPVDSSKYIKDKVENYLHDQVCSGAISLKQAQIEIATNWRAVYNRMPNK